MSSAAPDQKSAEDLLALADRLFCDFDDLPIMTVIRALNATRTELGCDPLNLCAVETLTREQLKRERAHPAKRPRVRSRPFGAWLGTLAFTVATAVDRLATAPTAT